MKRILEIVVGVLVSAIVVLSVLLFLKLRTGDGSPTTVQFEVAKPQSKVAAIGAMDLQPWKLYTIEVDGAKFLVCVGNGQQVTVQRVAK